MQHLDLTALRYFSETALTGSIRLASDRLHVTPSAVSRQIAKLEHRLATVLFERRPTGVVLTPSGQLLADELINVYGNLARVQTLIGDLEGLRRGEVTIHCLEGAVEAWLPGLIARFNDRHPHIEFAVVVSSTDRAAEALASGRCGGRISMSSRQARSRWLPWCTPVTRWRAARPRRWRNCYAIPLRFPTPLSACARYSTAI